MSNPVTHSVWLVGPTHPYTGGIAQHTTRLALELENRGVSVGVESWKSQYPSFLYRGTPTVPRGEPEIGAPSLVVEKLAWYSPLSWFLAGRRLATADRVVVSVPTAFHALPYTVMSLAMGRLSKLWAIVHNVVPHDSGRLSKTIMGWFLRGLNKIIVHSDQQRDVAVSLGVPQENIIVLPLPSPWPDSPPPPSTGAADSGAPRLLFFGTIRPYKGLDLLLEALSQVPGITLSVAGEFWEDIGRYEDLISQYGLHDRVTLRPGYVPSGDMADLFSKADCLVLPYRSGTGSIVRDVGFRHGVPVIATDVGAIADGIVHDTNGWVIPTPQVDTLVDALVALQTPGTIARWREGVSQQGALNASRWADYVDAVTAENPLSGDRVR